MQTTKLLITTWAKGIRLNLIGLGLLAIMLAAFPPVATQAATFNIADGDVAGLINAINTANGNGEANTINLASGGTYTLSAVNNTGWHGPNGLPIITSQLTINGNGATIQRSSTAGTPDFRIFLSSGGDFTLNGATIRGASHGWGGGGLRNVGLGKLSVMNSTVTENRGGDGGGILNYCGELIVVNSTISGNTSFGGYGGGGILNFSSYCVSTATISNSTIFENRADAPPGFQGRGDAIADAFSPQGSVTLKNSIVASPTRGLGNDCYAGVWASLGHNIAGDDSCGFNGAGDINSANPLLDTLANNGGLTPTHLPLTNSPTIDAVPLADCTDANGNSLATDQRGVSRPQGAACDIGSVEAQDTTAPETSITSAVDGNGATVVSNGSTLSNSITFTFEGTDAVGVAGFQCSLSSLNGAAYATCASPVTYSGLAIGSSHTFQVRALDAAGNVDSSPASFTLTILTPDQAVQNIFTTIGDMGLSGGVAVSLTATLNNFDQSNFNSACSKLDAFITIVGVKFKNGNLTQLQNDQLLDAANAIKASLGC